MTRLIDAFEQMFDGEGDPVVSGKLKFTQSGTNATDKDTYADTGETILNTNPVLLDAEGRVPDIFGTGQYRVTLYDSDDVQISQKDPVGVDGSAQLTEWSAVISYAIDWLLYDSDGIFYRSLQNNNENNEPSTSPAYWEKLDFIQVYNVNVSYPEGNLVLFTNGAIYEAQSDTTAGETPVTDPAKWSRVPPYIEPYDSAKDYDQYAIVIGSNNIAYQALLANGSSAPVSPIGDLTGTWRTLAFSDSFINESLTDLLMPHDYNDLYAGGWRPTFFNQQWGGAFGGESPDGSGDQAWFETGYLVGNSYESTGNNTAGAWNAIAFEVSQTITLEEIWFKLYKIGSPKKDTEPLAVYIYNDSSGPNALVTNATANAMNGHSMASASEHWEITRDTNGQLCKFTFATNPVLTAGTYYIVINASGNDGANHFRLIIDNTVLSYPHGNFWEGNDATPSVWSESASIQAPFLIKSTEATQLIQSGGQFDSKIKFAKGSPVNQSQVLFKPNKHFLNYKNGSIRIPTETCTFDSDETILDCNMGALDHDRIHLRTDSSGFLVLKLWESDGTLHTIQGDTDITGSSIKDIWIKWRAYADGSDYLAMYLNGAEEGTGETAQTITLDPLLESQGHTHLGGGFPVAPTWDESATGLPTADNFTWGGTATEANVSYVKDGIWMMQTLTTDTGWVDYDNAGDFNNSAGWLIAIDGLKINEVVNTSLEGGLILYGDDGTKEFGVIWHEYYIELTNGNSGAPNAQDAYAFINTKDAHHNYLIQGKGSDIFIWADGKLLIDGTNLLDDATNAADLKFGDIDATAASLCDFELTGGIKIYDGSELPYEVNEFTMSEYAYWSEDKTVLTAPAYNSGTPTSTKKIVGATNNFIERIKQKYTARGITQITTTTTSGIYLTESILFSLMPKGQAAIRYNGVHENSGTNLVTVRLCENGFVGGTANNTLNPYENAGMPICSAHCPGAGQKMHLSFGDIRNIHCGLNLHEIRWCVAAGTGRAYSRQMTVEEK